MSTKQQLPKNSDDSMNRWISYLERLIRLLRPKSYNTFARIIVLTGVALVVEGSTNLLQLLIFALYEQYFGQSEILRQYISGISNPYLGTGLIIVGLLYHYVMSVGLEQIAAVKANLSKLPSLSIRIANADNEEYSSNEILMRGAIAAVPKEDEISEYHSPPNPLNVFGSPFSLASINEETDNRDFYKERANLLRTWGGAELLRLSVTNQASTLAHNVSVEISLPRTMGISANNTNNDAPKLPVQRNPSPLFRNLESLSPLSARDDYDVKRDHTDSTFRFYWHIGNIQGGTSIESRTFIFIRAETHAVMHVTVFCDEFPEPQQLEYTIVPTSQTIDISANDIEVDDHTHFAETLDSCVMDGYVRRFVEKKYKKFESEASELHP